MAAIIIMFSTKKRVRMQMEMYARASSSDVDAVHSLVGGLRGRVGVGIRPERELSGSGG
jgi:hypothetical protein